MILWLGLNYQAWWSNQDWDLPLNAHIPNRITVKQNLLWQQSKNTGDSIWWLHSLMLSHINIMTEISPVAGGIHVLKVPYQNEAPFTESFFSNNCVCIVWGILNLFKNMWAQNASPLAHFANIIKSFNTSIYFNSCISFWWQYCSGIPTDQQSNKL